MKSRIDAINSVLDLIWCRKYNLKEYNKAIDIINEYCISADEVMVEGSKRYKNEKY